MTSTARQTPAFQPADLAQLAPLVKFGRCALVLGPLASCDANGRPLRHLLATEIAERFFRETGERLPEPENLSLVCTAFVRLQKGGKLGLEQIVHDFYKRHSVPSAVLKAAARLPFRLVFTAAHEQLLQKAFLTEGKRQCKSGFYRFAETQIDDFHHTPPGQTYIYQLFGRATEMLDGKLILTVADQLDYVDSVQGVGKETRIPTSLRNAMKECEAFLFVGFDFENWYLKVLFHILEFSINAKFVFGLPEGHSAAMGAATGAFFQNQYKFSFLADRSAELLEAIRQQIETGNAPSATGGVAERTLLFLHSNDPKDEAIRDRLDKNLASAKWSHGLRSESIHDFEADDDQTAKTRMVEKASVIIAVLSADFGANDQLMRLAEKALSRRGPSVVVAAVYARPAAGVADIFRGRAHVYINENLPLSLMDEDSGAQAIAKLIEIEIQTLPKP